MPYTRSRTTVLCLCCLLVAFTTAGCLEGSGVSNDEAKERALAAEAEHITAQLGNASCVESWGLASYAGVEKEAAIMNQTADGVYVEVTHPFWYSTEQEEADVGSDAQYYVTADTVQRVSGTNVSPC